MMVEMQFGVKKYFEIFDSVGACNSDKGFTQFVIKTKQVGFPRKGDNSGSLDVERH
jgi:hypothetical protein